ncbi:MAG: hypothetical protein HUJ90_06485 [Bacteroidales bacterium]|nr:hypothetical protein [Bacteroidales bacterium]
MKKIVALLLVSIFVLSGCSRGTDNSEEACFSKVPDEVVDASEKSERVTATKTDDTYDFVDNINLYDTQQLEALFEHYSIRKIIELRYDTYGEFLEKLGVPDIFLIIDELVDQGYYDDIEKLKTMADKIGYSQSAIFGNYIADGEHVVHLTDSPCFDNIDASELIAIGPFTKLQEIKNEILDDDRYLETYSLCDSCFNRSN